MRSVQARIQEVNNVPSALYMLLPTSNAIRQNL